MRVRQEEEENVRGGCGGEGRESGLECKGRAGERVEWRQDPGRGKAGNRNSKVCCDRRLGH